MMAGEIEDPFSISFEAYSVHSGSISFGRFENETLSWERRSSFSHNRYLEEVEKYSKPGSVSEKKAYFEAHFKKKALLRQSMSESQRWTEYQSNENDVLDNVDYIEKFESESQSWTEYQTNENDVLNNVDNREEFEHANLSNHYANFDESSEGSLFYEDSEVIKYGREDPAVLPFEYGKEHALDNADELVDTILNDVHPEEAPRTETGCDKLLPVKDVAEIDVNESLGSTSGSVDESYNAIISSTKSSESGEVNKTSLDCQKSPPKFTGAMEIKSTKPKLKSQVHISQVLKNVCSDAAKATAKSPSQRVRESSRIMKAENQSSENATSTTGSVHRTPKSESSESYKSKLHHANKSEKQLKVKVVVATEPSTLKKVETRAHQTANSSIKGTANMTKVNARTSAATFTFKSNERAEKRKEFFTKLEEKMHAKEAEINQIEARIQEKTVAEIKQLRKSLNFKATPMPSFYRVALPASSETNKAISKNNKPNRVQNKSRSPSRGTFKAANDQATSASESVITTDSLEASAAANCETAESGKICPSKNYSSETVVKTEVIWKKRLETKDSDFQKHRVTEGSNKGVKCQKSEGKQKVLARTRRSGNEMMRKEMKSVGIGSNPGIGHVSVGVAS